MTAGEPGRRHDRQRMLECEARMVLGWPLERRRRYLDGVAKARGVAACDELKAEVMRQWKSR